MISIVRGCAGGRWLRVPGGGNRRHKLPKRRPSLIACIRRCSSGNAPWSGWIYGVPAAMASNRNSPFGSAYVVGTQNRSIELRNLAFSSRLMLPKYSQRSPSPARSSLAFCSFQNSICCGPIHPANFNLVCFASGRSAIEINASTNRCNPFSGAIRAK